MPVRTSSNSMISWSRVLGTFMFSFIYLVLFLTPRPSVMVRPIPMFLIIGFGIQRLTKTTFQQLFTISLMAVRPQVALGLGGGIFRDSLSPPWVKSFIWLVVQGKVKTYDYLNVINLGPFNPCVFCGLVTETAEHIFNSYPKTQGMWALVAQITGKDITFDNQMCDGF